MIKPTLISAAALLASLSLAQGYGPPAARGPVAERAPVRVEATRATMRERAIATRVASEADAGFAGRMQAGAGAGGAGLGGSLQGVVASAIGLSESEVHEQKVAGASLGSIAEAQGVDLATLESAYLAARDGLIAERLAAEAITELQAERMSARGAAAFATLIAREGCDEGRNVTGEPLHAQRVDAPRGPAVDAQVQRGPRARW